MKLSAALLLGVTALALIPLAEAPSHAAADQSADRFAPPASELVLTRTVIRELSDGKQIVVTRHFRIRFTADGDGYRIDGIQTGVEVEAPANLASMAELERQRVETGAFPLHLSRNGILVDQHGQVIDPAFSTAIENRGAALLNSPETPAEERAANAKALRGMTNQGSHTPWPADLFSAVPGERRLERVVHLSDGREGKVEVVLKVDGLLSCGMPKSFERIVITELPGSRMVSREIFTLSELAG